MNDPATESSKIDKEFDHATLESLLKRLKLLNFLTIAAFLAGIGSGYLMWGMGLAQGSPTTGSAISDPEIADNQAQLGELSGQINPPEGFTLPVTYGDIGPKMVEAGAIDAEKFIQVYEQAGVPLTEEQIKILTHGSNEAIVIDQNNAYFLLNFFWAFGLTNQNELLTEGPMVQYSEGEVGRFASTGGWTISTHPLEEIYSSTAIVSLTDEQQERVYQVASNVFRPCCNNPTHFPDCNHGMAMLGLLELMAAQGASTDDMFRAAKSFNAFWFPQQTFEIALYFQAAEGLNFDEIDAKQMVSADFSSGSGFQRVHRWLEVNGYLNQSPDGGGSSCSV